MIQHLVPATDCGDNFDEVGDPLKGFAVSVVFVEEAVDGGLKVDDGRGDTITMLPVRCNLQQGPDCQHSGLYNAAEDARLERNARKAVCGWIALSPHSVR